MKIIEQNITPLFSVDVVIEIDLSCDIGDIFQDEHENKWVVFFSGPNMSRLRNVYSIVKEYKHPISLKNLNIKQYGEPTGTEWFWKNKMETL